MSFQVIPPFNEENYEHDEIVPSSSSHDSEFQAFSSARAIPSKSGLGSLVFEDALLTKEAAAVESADVAATSRQSKKAPLPHHYEPSTIAGITIGAFLLIFIGTGNILFHIILAFSLQKIGVARAPLASLVPFSLST